MGKVGRKSGAVVNGECWRATPLQRLKIYEFGGHDYLIVVFSEDGENVDVYNSWDDFDKDYRLKENL